MHRVVLWNFHFFILDKRYLKLVCLQQFLNFKIRICYVHRNERFILFCSVDSSLELAAIFGFHSLFFLNISNDMLLNCQISDGVVVQDGGYNENSV